MYDDRLNSEEKLISKLRQTFVQDVGNANFGVVQKEWKKMIENNPDQVMWGMDRGYTWHFDEEVGPGLPLWLPNGTIIVDEEHDVSYKQDEGVIYNARDMAVVRAKKSNIPIILSSATLSIETKQNINEKTIYEVSNRYSKI